MAFRAQCGCLVWLRLLPHAAFLVLVRDLYAVLAAQNACFQNRDSSEPAAFLGAVALHTCTPHAPQRWHTSSDATAAYHRRSDAVLMPPAPDTRRTAAAHRPDTPTFAPCASTASPAKSPLPPASAHSPAA